MQVGEQGKKGMGTMANDEQVANQGQRLTSTTGARALRHLMAQNLGVRYSQFLPEPFPYPLFILDSVDRHSYPPRLLDQLRVPVPTMRSAAPSRTELAICVRCSSSVLVRASSIATLENCADQNTGGAQRPMRHPNTNMIVRSAATVLRERLRPPPTAATRSSIPPPSRSTPTGYSEAPRARALHCSYPESHAPACLWAIFPQPASSLLLSYRPTPEPDSPSCFPAFAPRLPAPSIPP